MAEHEDKDIRYVYYLVAGCLIVIGIMVVWFLRGWLLQTEPVIEPIEAPPPVEIQSTTRQGNEL